MKQVQLQSDKGGEIKVKTALALAYLAFVVWVIYLLIQVADYINAWPFNGGWPF